MSTPPRLHLDAPLGAGAELAAAPGQAHYLGTVLRRAVGDPVRLFNGRDGEWAARIAALRKDRAAFVVERQLRPAAPEPDIRLLVAAIKRDAMDWIAEKATELGAALIQPVFTRRTVAGRVNTSRLAAIAREAAEQCGRLTVPRLADPAPLHAVLDGWDPAVPLLAGDERRASPPLARVVAGIGLRPPFGWLVGPEGGFESAELDDLRRRPFVSTVALGPRILRAETAVVAGLAALQALAGDWTGTI
ncbi:16S rRNA (uracil(1498)-N(3))-methyltransferase [Caldovatus aquaticus]|uniref:Ribosomal RNA small subunit methyltransferase E n=1 Tax=Caldovatus aquaticus TaxID=2865671 RepID=A0ABS7EY19_9PROT|nr:16S rRNA (uracil(1498)-N(3))-methyltransferase [Caldovatus aquaticus]MBW8268246.1 16S rRNA (uracil(1498)-N(3))-methyltransferase [Caldovatus aquaticus]